MNLDASGEDAPGDAAGGVLVIGYGNTLRSDDGVGWHVAALLADDPRLAVDPPVAADVQFAADSPLAANSRSGADLRLAGVEVLAVHQLTPELAVDMSRASLVILIDASVDDPPGAITVRPVTDDGDVTRGAAGPSSHHVGPGELLAVARVLYGHAPVALTVSVGIAHMGAGESLSPDVAAVLPAAADAVVDLVATHRRSRAARHPGA